MFFASEKADVLGRVVDLVRQGQVRADASAAATRWSGPATRSTTLRGGRVRGKAVIVP